MLHKTTGIVLRTIKYSETSIITNIYTRSHGLLSFIVNGVRSSRSKQKASAFQPMMMLELEIYFREQKNLLRIKEYRHHYIYRSIPFDVLKSSIALFYLDVLNRVIKEHEKSESLYAFVEQAFLHLDECNEGLSILPLQFLLHLCQHLGFYPDANYSDTRFYFDLMEGHFTATPKRIEYSIGAPLSEKLFLLMQASEVHLNYDERKELLHQMLNYYTLHNADLRRLQSLKVLEEIFN
jgi:DNA repair protein RecO (recombination protein O)